MRNVDAIFKSKPSMYWEQRIEDNTILGIIKSLKRIRVLFAK